MCSCFDYLKLYLLKGHEVFFFNFYYTNWITLSTASHWLKHQSCLLFSFYLITDMIFFLVCFHVKISNILELTWVRLDLGVLHPCCMHVVQEHYYRFFCCHFVDWSPLYTCIDIISHNLTIILYHYFDFRRVFTNLIMLKMLIICCVETFIENLMTLCT